MDALMNMVADLIFPVGAFVIGVFASNKVKSAYHKLHCKVMRMLGKKDCGGK